MPDTPRRLGLAAGYGGSLLIAVLSLVPAVARPHTGAGGAYEHWMAYTLVGAAFGLGYRSAGARLAAGLALTAGAGILEGLQNFVPGRNPEVTGFVASSLGAWSGLALAFAAGAVLRSARR